MLCKVNKQDLTIGQMLLLLLNIYTKLMNYDFDIHEILFLTHLGL